MNQTATCTPIPRPLTDLLPTELRTERRWVVARFEGRTDGKPTKVPYCPDAPMRRADTTDPSTWSDFGTAARLVTSKEFPALGFVLGDGFVGVDLDGCRDAATGVIEPWAQEVIDRLDSYTDISVSGSGIHVICRGTLPDGRRRKGQVEMYDRARYFVMTGASVTAHSSQSGIADRTAELATLHAEVFSESGTDSIAVATCSGSRVTTADDDLVIAALTKDVTVQRLWSGDTSGYDSRSEADLAFCRHLATHTNADGAQMDRLFRRSGLYRPKWDRQDYRDRTIRVAVTGLTAAPSESDAQTTPTPTTTGKKSTKTKSSTSGQSTASKLIGLVAKSGADLFHDTDGEPYVTVAVGARRETMPLHGSQFGEYLAHEYYTRTGKAATPSAVRNAETILARMARQGSERPVFVRVARQLDAIWIDLGDPEWRAVKIGPSGWEIVPSPDVRVGDDRYRHDQSVAF